MTLSITTQFHFQIQETINQCLIEFGQVPLAVVDEEEDDAIKVRLVSSDDEHLRGFVGISEIFINATHFQKKIARFEGSLDALQLIAKMDIISVSIHEVAHLRFRKVRRISNQFIKNKIHPQIHPTHSFDDLVTPICRIFHFLSKI